MSVVALNIFAVVIIFLFKDAESFKHTTIFKHKVSLLTKQIFLVMILLHTLPVHSTIFILMYFSALWVLRRLIRHCNSLSVVLPGCNGYVTRNLGSYISNTQPFRLSPASGSRHAVSRYFLLLIIFKLTNFWHRQLNELNLASDSFTPAFHLPICMDFSLQIHGLDPAQDFL